MGFAEVTLKQKGNRVDILKNRIHNRGRKNRTSHRSAIGTYSRELKVSSSNQVTIPQITLNPL